MALAAKVSAHSLADLRQVPADKLLETRVAMNPIVDGWFLPADPYTVFTQGKEAAVPLLTGWNTDEGATFPHAKTVAGYQQWVRQKYPDIADRLLEHGVHGAPRGCTPITAIPPICIISVIPSRFAQGSPMTKSIPPTASAHFTARNTPICSARWTY